MCVSINPYAPVVTTALTTTRVSLEVYLPVHNRHGHLVERIGNSLSRRTT